MSLQVKVDAPRRDHARTRRGCAEGEGQAGHGHGVRIVRMHDVRLPLVDDTRELPRGGEIDLVARRQGDEIRSFGRAAIELALGVGDEHGLVPERAQTEDGQENLVLSAAPGAGGVDVEGEHSSHSFENFKPT